MILNETFPPGTFLSEPWLSERLQMSKTPIRAALEHLEAEGFVSIAPRSRPSLSWRMLRIGVSSRSLPSRREGTPRASRSDRSLSPLTGLKHTSRLPSVPSRARKTSSRPFVLWKYDVVDTDAKAPLAPKPAQPESVLQPGWYTPVRNGHKTGSGTPKIA